MTAAPSNTAASNFWSRRRAAVQAEEAALAAARDADLCEQDAPAPAPQQDDRPDAVILAELGLKDPDLMQMGDDFSAFLQKTVPEHLRRRALRRLWRSNPVLANLDGLVDFNEDYTDAATVVPDLKTSYQVGKGLMQHVLAMAEKAEADRAKAALPPEPEAQREPEPETGPETGPDAEPAPQMAQASPAQDTPHAAPEQDAPALPRRHMRFSFET